MELTEPEWTTDADVDMEENADCVGDHDPDLENVEEPVGAGGSVEEPEEEKTTETVS